jgi:hypothetical protein
MIKINISNARDMYDKYRLRAEHAILRKLVLITG